MCGSSLGLDASAVDRTRRPTGGADGPIFLRDIVARYARTTGAYTGLTSRRKAPEEKDGRRQRPHPIHWNLEGHEPGNLPTMPCNAMRFCHGLDSDKARRIEQVGEEVLSATTHMVVCQVFPCMSTEDIRVPLPCPGMYCYPRSSSGHIDFGHEPCQPLPRASSAPEMTHEGAVR